MLSNKKDQYNLVVKNPNVLAKQNEIKAVAGNAAINQIKLYRNLTLLFSASVCTLCGIYGYSEWKKRIANQPCADENQEVEDSMERLKSYFKPTEPAKPMKLKLTIEDQGYLDPRKEGYDEARVHRSPNRNVAYNKKSDSLEVCTSRWRGGITTITSIPAHKVIRDDDGNFVFNEQGYPVMKRNRLHQFILDDIERMNKLIDFLKAPFR